MFVRRWVRPYAVVLISLGLFLVALFPRAVGLGVFATADEAKWVYRSAQFLGALLRGDLAGTAVNLTPAVTTTWLGSLGLAGYYAFHKAELGVPLAVWLDSLPEFRAELDVLVAVRWPMVLLMSVGVVAFYHLARRLTTEWVALVFALLLALDPHFIALSRVLGHDALAGLFVGLSLLSFMLATQGGDEEIGSSPGFKWGWLIGSGMLAGLAWLSKSPAFFLVPFVGLVAVVEAWRLSTPVRVWLLRLVVWGVVAWLTFVLAWPAGWVTPIGVLYSVVHNAFLSATDQVEAAAEGYWLVPNLGPFYYLVNGVFKLAPLAMLGLIGWGWLIVSRRRKASSLEWWLLAFAVFFTAFMTMGGKRSNRYILPAWPALYLLAAAAIIQISKRLHDARAQVPANQQVSKSNRRRYHYPILGVLLLLVVLPALITYPYYLTYFNPLLGGPLTAPRLVKIGWGEGLDQVGRWLDQRPGASAARVGSYYASALAPFFRGKIRGVTDDGLDYVVLYLKQAQEGYPLPSILRYFDAEDPLQIVRLNGIEYARIYAGPGVQPALANEAAFDIGILPKPLAFRPDHPYLPIGQEVAVDVLWLAGDDLPRAPSRLTVQPLDDLTRRPGERGNDVFAESLAQLERRSDGLIISQHELRLPPDLPRGSYGLLVDGRPLGAAEARQFTSPPVDERLNANFGGQLRLDGYRFDATTNTLSLVWQAAPRAWADYTVFVHVVDGAGNRLAGSDAQPLVPTSQWARGEVVVDERVVPIPDDLSPGEYRLVVGLYHAGIGDRVPLLDEAGTAVGDSLLLPMVPTGDSGGSGD
jgi:4-amino-4-deoxy-L-arabinose transferase-like glycosyltransferase